jgi:hypothetical protein
MAEEDKMPGEREK